MPSNRLPAARAIIYAAAYGGLTIDQANELLASVGLEDQSVPKATWDMIQGHEVHLFGEDPKRMGEFIYHPKPRSRDEPNR